MQARENHNLSQPLVSSPLHPSLPLLPNQPLNLYPSFLYSKHETLDHLQREVSLWKDSYLDVAREKDQ